MSFFDSFTISRTIKNIIKIYSKERSIGSSHEDALDQIIKAQFVFSATKQAEVKRNFFLLETSSQFEHLYDKHSESQKIKSDLRVLSISVLMVMLERDYKEYQNKITKDFAEIYEHMIS